MRSENVAQIRAQLGLTQQELADLLRVHRITVTRWEAGTGQVPPTVALLLRLIADPVIGSRARKIVEACAPA